MYTHFYGFSEEPFGDAPDPRFLFLLPGHQQILNCLLQGIEDKKGWILLLGDAGSGKTLIIHHLLNLLNEKPKVKAAFVFQPQVLLEDFLKEALSALGLPSAPPKGISVADHFKQCLKQQISPDIDLVLFIDEAQGFGAGMLEEIYKFFRHEPKEFPPIQIVFAGQPGLEEKLESQELRALSRQIQVRCKIAALTGMESQRYIDHRLHFVGGKPEVFSPDALALILRKGNGVPRTLNLLCDNSLRIGHQISEPRISAATVEKALREMYLEKDRPPHPFQRKRGSAIRHKVFFALMAVVALALVTFIAHRFLALNPSGRVAPSAGDPSRGEWKPPEPSAAVLPAPLPNEKTAMPPPPVQSTLESPGQISPPASDSSEKSKYGLRTKKIIVVKKGDTLNSLSTENYGRVNLTLLDFIMQLNPQITDPNLILPYQRIKFPEINEQCLLVPVADGTLRIYLGTFRDRDGARPFKEDPALKGKEIKTIARRVLPGETWYQIEAGIYSSEEEALKAIRILRAKGLLLF